MSGNAWQRLRASPGLGRLADLGMGPRAASRKTKTAGARIAGLKATESICPYCAVGCAQVVYTRGGEVKYRRPHGTEWEDLELETAMDMVAERAPPVRRGGRITTTRISASTVSSASRTWAAPRSTTRRTSSVSSARGHAGGAAGAARALITTVREVDLVAVVDRSAASGR